MQTNDITPAIVVTLTPAELNVARLALCHWDGWNGNDTIDDETDSVRYELARRLNNVYRLNNL